MQQPVKLLIIDDEDIVLKSCKKILSKRDDLQIDTASSGQEGLDRTDNEEYDIVITDLKMPGISGMEVLKTLQEKKPGITVIIFTGYATVETAREALTNGAFDYIPKPFTPEELRDIVDNAITSRESESDTQMLDLMAIVSHELKSPVSVVHTTAETLYKGYFGNLDPQQQKTIQTILRNCEYLEDIIRNYIDLSKMELDDLKSFQKRINLLTDVIQPIIEIPEHVNNNKNISVDTKFEVEPEVYGDKNLLKIVVTNYLNNAIKYGRPDTTVTIRLYQEKDSYIFSVYNEGVGIPEDNMNKLFNKFSRLKQKGTEGIKGSGLGLYICRKIIEKHKGTVWAESKHNEWVTFYFSLPRIDK